MFNPRAMLAIASVGALVACHSANSSEPDLSHADIANITKVHTDFPQDFKVRDIAKTGIDAERIAVGKTEAVEGGKAPAAKLTLEAA